MDDITILQAEVLETLASPRRLEILHALAKGPIEVGRLAEMIGATQPNVSQHLGILRGAGLVEAMRDGREVRYALVDPDVMVACGLMRSVLERRLARRLARLGAIGAGAASRAAAPPPLHSAPR
jgi:DNA-binding transcriptional ArsR family regulator